MRTKAWWSLFLFATWNFSSAAPTDQWGQWQRDAQHSGAIHESLLLSQRRFSWSTKVSSYAITGLAATDKFVVTIDSLPAIVYGAALASGSVGLYQIAIQVPSSLANGTWPIQAMIGGVSSPTGIVLTVHQ